MTRLSGMLLACAGLVGVIALEINDAQRGNVTPPQTLAATPLSPRSVAPDHVRDWVAAVLARPLFSPDRRPAAAPVSTASNRVPGLPRLAGILVGPSGRSAIFAADGSKPIVAQEGGHVGAYTIKAIETAQVQLAGPDGTRVLNPSFDSAPGKTAGTTAAPVRRPGQAPLPR